MNEKGVAGWERQPFAICCHRLGGVVRVVLRRSTDLCPLVEVVQSQFTLIGACGAFSVAREDSLLIIICADATPLWQTSATKRYVPLTIWLEGVVAASDVQR